MASAGSNYGARFEPTRSLTLLRQVEEDITDAIQASGLTSLSSWLISWIQGGTSDDALIHHIAKTWNAAQSCLHMQDILQFNHDLLIKILMSNGNSAQNLAKNISIQIKRTDKRKLTQQNKKWNNIIWPKYLLSIFKLPALALGTAIASLLLFLTVFKQPEYPTMPVLINMQVFGFTELRMRNDGRLQLSLPFELQDGDQLESGDYYQIRLSADRDVHVYLLVSSDNHPPFLLFQDTMRAGEVRNLPGNDQLFLLDQTKGTECLSILLSEKELPVQETLTWRVKDGQETTLRQVFPEATIRTFRLEHR